jgi:hypothetical protein
MPSDLLQQLRDIHLPAEPGWWPPAPGWWLLAALLAAAFAWMIGQLINRARHRRPGRRARQLFTDLQAAYQAGDLPAATFVHESNELLKRLLIHGFGIDAARAASDHTWLRLLDERYGKPEFTQGPGRALGNDRFRRSPSADIELLAALLDSFFRKVRP